MFQEFVTYINKLSLFNADKRILLAVSGGIDSSVMAHLFHQSNYPFAIAHCNFKLRGADADNDEAFVKKLATTYKVDYYTTSFDTTEYAQEHKLSIQQAARELRYNWFEQIRQKNNFDYIATAHNQNDTVETFFINLSRSSGLKGLTGVPAKNNKIVRPLLFASRNTIEQYANQHSLKYRIDGSNLEDDYLRNAIRLNVLPQLEKQTPSFIQSASQSINYLQQAQGLIETVIDDLKKKLIVCQLPLQYSINELIKVKNYEYYLPFLFNEYNLNSDNIETLKTIIRSEKSGQLILTSTHQLVKSRDVIEVIKNDSTVEIKSILIDSTETEVTTPIKLQFQKMAYDGVFSNDLQTASLDADLIQFPLELRPWQHGDKMKPLGLKGKSKLISDLLADAKTPNVQKQETYVLVSAGKIIWLVGHRISEEFCVKNDTKFILEIRHLS